MIYIYIYIYKYVSYRSAGENVAELTEMRVTALPNGVLRQCAPYVLFFFFSHGRRFASAVLQECVVEKV